MSIIVTISLGEENEGRDGKWLIQDYILAGGRERLQTLKPVLLT